MDDRIIQTTGTKYYDTIGAKPAGATTIYVHAQHPGSDDNDPFYIVVY